jgi:hypothetical protein
MDPISGKHQVGAVLASTGAFLLFRRALALPPTAPHSSGSVDRAIYVLLACALLAYAWSVLMAVLARSKQWTPKGCRTSGYPLLALGVIAHAAVPQSRAILDMGGLFVLAELSGRLCRYLAYPELGWSGKDPAEPSLSIKLGPSSRPEMSGNKPIG